MLDGRHFTVQIISVEDECLYVIILNEVTEQVMAQKILQKSHHELEVKVKERTIELAKVKGDLEDCKRTEEALQGTEEQDRSLVENINDVIFATDQKGIITYVSPAIEPVAGYRPSELTGRPFGEFIHSEDLPRIREAFMRVLSGQREPNEYRIVGRSGKTTWVRVSSMPVQRDGHVIGLHGIITDTTEGRRLGQQLEQVQGKEGTGGFTSGLAHEMNNLMNVVLSYCSFMLEGLSEGDQWRNDVTKIKEAGEEAVSLIKQLRASGPDHTANPMGAKPKGQCNWHDKDVGVSDGKGRED